MLQSITNSLDSLVSPPTMSTLYSLETLLNPKSKLRKLFSEYFLGIPTEIRHAYGLTPFAAKSLTHAITLFLAICQGCIKEGTSVLSTNMSHFKMRFMQDWPVLTEITAISSLAPLRADFLTSRETKSC